jgi:outer membrane protein TolC
VPSIKTQLRAVRLGSILNASLIAGIFLLPAIAAAQGTPTLPTVQTVGTRRAISLDEAVRIAESQSEAIRIARAGVQRAEGQRYQARSQRLPQLSASAGYTRTLAFAILGR